MTHHGEVAFARLTAIARRTPSRCCMQRPLRRSPRLQRRRPPCRRTRRHPFRSRPHRRGDGPCPCPPRSRAPPPRLSGIPPRASQPGRHRRAPFSGRWPRGTGSGLPPVMTPGAGLLCPPHLTCGSRPNPSPAAPWSKSPDRQERPISESRTTDHISARPAVWISPPPHSVRSSDRLGSAPGASATAWSLPVKHPASSKGQKRGALRAAGPDKAARRERTRGPGPRPAHAMPMRTMLRSWAGAWPPKR